AAFLEANYDVDMLMQGRYPFFLKNRIRNGYGHLSNTEALELFTKHRSPTLSHLLLSHLSRDNNDPELVTQLFNNHRKNTQVVVAGRYSETDVYRVASTASSAASRFQIPDESAVRMQAEQ